MEQGGNDDMSDAVKREVTQVLQEGHGADKGVAIGASCLFFDFETCEEIEIRRSKVRFPSLHDVACRMMHPVPAVHIAATRR